MSNGPRHASFREVADIVDGLLVGARLARVRAHLDGGCAQCEDALQRARGLVACLASGPLPRPPAAVQRRASALFGEAWRRSAVGRVREVIASLLVDQRLAPVAALRGAPGTGRRLLWTVPGAELVVGVSERGGRHDLLGQGLPDDDTDDAAPSGSVELLRDGSVAGSATLDDEGGFALRTLPSGTYVLRGCVDSTAFRTPPFVVG